VISYLIIINTYNYLACLEIQFNRTATKPVVVYTVTSVQFTMKRFLFTASEQKFLFPTAFYFVLFEIRVQLHGFSSVKPKKLLFVPLLSEL
jgi:hypothetical protein